MGLGFLDQFMNPQGNDESNLSHKMGFGTGVGTPLYAMQDEQQFQNGQNNYGGLASLAMLMNAYAAKAAAAYGGAPVAGGAVPPMMGHDMMSHGFQPGQLDRGGPLDQMSHSNYAHPMNDPTSGFWHTQDILKAQGIPYTERNMRANMQTPAGFDMSGYAHVGQQTPVSAIPPPQEPSLFAQFMNAERTKRMQPFRRKPPFAIGGASPSYQDFNNKDHF